MDGIEAGLDIIFSSLFKRTGAYLDWWSWPGVCGRLWETWGVGSRSRGKRRRPPFEQDGFTRHDLYVPEFGRTDDPWNRRSRSSTVIFRRQRSEEQDQIPGPSVICTAGEQDTNQGGGPARGLARDPLFLCGKTLPEWCRQLIRIADVFARSRWSCKWLATRADPARNSKLNSILPSCRECCEVPTAVRDWNGGGGWVSLESRDGIEFDAVLWIHQTLTVYTGYDARE